MQGQSSCDNNWDSSLFIECIVFTGAGFEPTIWWTTPHLRGLTFRAWPYFWLHLFMFHITGEGFSWSEGQNAAGSRSFRLVLYLDCVSLGSILCHVRQSWYYATTQSTAENGHFIRIRPVKTTDNMPRMQRNIHYWVLMYFFGTYLEAFVDVTIRLSSHRSTPHQTWCWFQ